jgi:hypothetical protein
MNGAKLILSVGIWLVVAGSMAAACGTSSSGPGADRDSGPSSDVRETDTSGDASGATCDPYTFELCPPDQTCCFSGLRGTCTPVNSSCNAPFRVSCQNTRSCHDAGVCCVGVQFDAAPIEAGGFTLSFVCESSCTFPQFQVCMTTEDCQNGQVCVNISAPDRPAVLTCLPPDAGIQVADASPEAGGSLPDASDAGAGASDASGDAPDGG